jgi:hypothetical protein
MDKATRWQAVGLLLLAVVAPILLALLLLRG